MGVNVDAAIMKVQRLLALATGATGGEEARTAAIVAARLIVEHNLLGATKAAVAARPRPHDELRSVIHTLLQTFIDVAWRERRTDNLVTVPVVVDHAIQNGDLHVCERERAMAMLANLVNQEKRRGVLVSVRGRYGGYRLASGVRRGRAA